MRAIRVFGGVALGAGMACAIACATQPAGLGRDRLKAADSLALVCRVFAGDHEGRFPNSKVELELHGGFAPGDLDRFWQPSPQIRFERRPGVEAGATPETIFIYIVGPVRFGKHYAARVDGSGVFVTRAEIEEQFEF